MATSGKAKRDTSVSSKQSAKERRAAEQKRRERQQFVLLAIVAGVIVVFIVGAIAVSLISANNVQASAANAFIPPAALTNYKDIEDQKLYGQTPEGFPYMGAENAPVLLEEVGSFSCSVCQIYHRTITLNLLDQVKAGRLKYVYIPVATTGEFDPSPITRAALAAQQQGKFWAFHDIAFDWFERYGSQENNPVMLEAAAKAVGLDLTKFREDMNSSAIQDIVSKGEAAFQARALPKGQIGTPTVFLDGVQIQPPVNNQASPNLNELRGLIEQRAAAKK